MFTKATSLVHHWISAHVRRGDLVMDATCGNGHDTMLLASLVGEHGRVVALDIQRQAVASTRQKLETANLLDRCSLHCLSHARVADVVPVGTLLDCAIFNLGYLPGSDKSVITQPDSSLLAHEAVVERLAPGGVLFSTIYTGHEGGQEEADRLLAWSARLPSSQFSVARHEWFNQSGKPPFILIISHRGSR